MSGVGAWLYSLSTLVDLLYIYCLWIWILDSRPTDVAADRDSWRSTCATGLESFAAASEQAASDRRARRHATAQSTRVGPACPQCGRVCASDFGLRSHLRVHERPQ